MPTFKHILFPVDFSDRCKAICPLVMAMAERFESRLTLMHVIETPIGWYGGIEAAYPAMFDVPAMTKEVCEKLDKFFDQPQATVKIENVVDHGDPAARIGAYVEKNGVDLIMISTQGCGTFRSLLLGSVVAKVLHDSKCAVWTAAHTEDFHWTELVKNGSILCAVDLEPESVPLIRAAADLAVQLKAKLILVHAVSATESLPDKYLNTDFRQFLFDSNLEILTTLQRQAGVDAEVCMEGGRVSAVVSYAARHCKADLVVIGRGRLYETLGRLRTNAYAVIRDCPCPVLSF